MTATDRGRISTVLRITVEYLVVWAATVATWMAIGAVWSSAAEGGSEFDWSGVALAALGATVALVGGHAWWAARTVTLLKPYGRAWRPAVVVVPPPASLVVVVVAVNESVAPWQLWPVALVVVPAAGAALATTRR